MKEDFKVMASKEYSLLVDYQMEDETIEQKILEVALRYGIRSYEHSSTSVLFTHPNENILKYFQKKLINLYLIDINLNFVFNPPLSK